MHKSSVKVRRERITIPTYLPEAPDRNPMFLERRVYQGSSGRVYPLPAYNRIADRPVDHKWDAIYVENEFIEVMLLPQIGGRIHALRDKTNGYDTIYRQATIKPALVGLAGPWASGGIEFNWPQHHRPATFMPTQTFIEEHADGSRTVWMGDHDPMNRLKGMHGVCVHPDRSVLELKVRLHNRTDLVQTFLWWANVATAVHELYQSFFPPDVTYVADHAKRATSTFPLASDHYYGVNYGARPKTGVPVNERPKKFVPPSGKYSPNDLSWYANIPVPTSYMAMGSRENFFGGYDHRERAGLVHVARRQIAPGKKQWTWGNHDFGYSWDRNLSDDARPYIELMAGVFTDNQPDFSFLMPGETRTFSQFWYPIREIGAAKQANVDAAVTLTSDQLGVSSSRRIDATIKLLRDGKAISTWRKKVSPDHPFVEAIKKKYPLHELRLEVWEKDRLIISYQPAKPKPPLAPPPPATEPPPPDQVKSNDELFIIGLHLEQYRHATRSPDIYWREAIRRDPLDSRANNSMGLWSYRRGEFEIAKKYFETAIQRLTARNPNPYDGEAYYNLGLTLRALGDLDGAYDAFYKATWNRPWQSAGFRAIAEIDCVREDWTTALEHLDRSLKTAIENLKARNLKVIVLRKLNRADDAKTLLNETRALDPLDNFSKWLDGERRPSNDSQVYLDLAIDFMSAGLYANAIEALRAAPTETIAGTAPLIQYYLAYCFHKSAKGDVKAALARAARANADYCFPSRVEEIAILEFAQKANPSDARAPYYLGNLFYDRRRYRDAIAQWERAVKLDGKFAIAWRNLGIAYFNVSKNPTLAQKAYERAIKCDPSDSRLRFEYDQLLKRRAVNPARRLALLDKCPQLVAERDDLTLERCALLNQLGQAGEARDLLLSRRFQPWEGGEGVALAQHVRAHLTLGRIALAKGDAKRAVELFAAAKDCPENLGEARHPLANQCDVLFWQGVASDAAGDGKSAKQFWREAAEFKGDFQEMSVRAFSEMTFYSALATQKLGQKKQADKLIRDLRKYAIDLEKSPAKIDYFATSLPTLLLFEDDLQMRQAIAAQIMQAQAFLFLGKRKQAQTLLTRILRADPSNAVAADVLQIAKSGF